MLEQGRDAPGQHARTLRCLPPLLALVGAMTALRLVYVFWLCPYNLVEDEASYWEWSRRLDWSYYSKGPGIAWAIRAATALLGTSEGGIRTVPVISGGLAAGAVGLLAGLCATTGMHGSAPRVARSAALYSAGLFFLSPIFQVTSIFATIDAPYIACWAGATLFAFLALERGSRWAWPALGLSLGVGFLFKYTILLLIPGLLAYALLRRRRLTLAPGWPRLLLVTLLIFIAGLVPVLYWNQSRGWPTLAHLLGHVGARAGDMPESHERYRPAWTLDFLGTQIGAVGPALVIALIAAIGAVRGPRPPRAASASDAADTANTGRAARLFLVACAAPILLFYLAISFFTEPEGNWAMGGYVTLIALAGWALAEAMPRHRDEVAAWKALPPPRPRRGLLVRRPSSTHQVLWHMAIGYGLIVALATARADLLARAIAPTSPDARFAKARESAARRAASLTAPSVLGRDAGRRAEELRTQTDREPFFIAQHYGRAAILAFYTPGRPIVRCSSSRMGGRRTQYDFWPDHSLDDPALQGRPALLSGATLEQWQPLFERVEPIGRLEGEHKKDRLAFLGYGYKGWGRPAGPPTTGK